MRNKRLIVPVVLALAALAVFVSRPFVRHDDGTAVNEFTVTNVMRIESPAFGQGDPIPPRFTCDGDNIFPPLVLSKVPEDAASLAFIVDDPDAPVGTFVHWLAWNVSPEVSSVAEGTPPEGVQGTTGFGRVGWGGPCPPNGEHRYFFKVFALDTTIDLPEGASVNELEAAMRGHILDKAGLIGVYGR